MFMAECRAMVSFMRLPLALLLILALSGCAERWTRPGTTEAEADAANASCTDKAELAVPPAMAWQIVEPAGTDYDRQCWRQDGRELCRTIPRYRPARWGWVDLARGQRDAWRRECMRDQGFRFEGYRPLRLE
jgi:hypothetical protein